MGNLCGTNVYQEIKNKYPKQLVSMLTANQISSGLGDQFSGIQNKVSSAISGAKQDSIGQIDQKQNSILDQFKTIKNQLNLLPGGVQKIEQQNGGKLQDLLGMGSIMNKFTGMKSELNNKFAEQQRAVNSNIQNIKTQKVAQAQALRPNIPELQNLNPSLKNEILKSGMKEFGGEVAKNSQGFFGGITNLISIDTITSKFKSFLPTQSLNNLTGSSSSMLTQAAKKFLPSGIPSGAGSAFGGLF